AIAPTPDRCSIHRELAGKDYFIVDDRNTRSMLLSNKLDGATDKNPLRETVLHQMPQGIAAKPKNRIVFEGKIQLLGWSIPPTASRGEKIEMTLYYQILQPVGANWKTLVHVDGPLRIGGDHEPINGVCQTSTWMKGDYIVDTFSVVAGGGAHPSGKYDVWT